MFIFYIYILYYSWCRFFIIFPLFDVDPLLMYRLALPFLSLSLSLSVVGFTVCRLVVVVGVVDTQGDLGTSSPTIQPLLSATRVHRLDQVDV